MYEWAIKAIRDYRDIYLFEPDAGWKKWEFEERSCSRWAAQEIICRLIEQEEIPPWKEFDRYLKTPVEMIEEFMDEMAYLADESFYLKKKYVFMVAKEAANDILLLFL